ncbi:MAG: rod shape-determining protein MreC [Chloroflexi bacterium]|nr:rod shape-determining protein MreC [Chloroflexota bacterium]
MRPRTSFSLFLLSLVLLAGVVADRGRTVRSLHEATLRAIVPVQAGLAVTLAALGPSLQTDGELSRLRGENLRLQETVAELNAAVVRLRELEIENRRLREELGYQRTYPEFTRLAATVIGEDPSNLVRAILIDKGADQGVKNGMSVVSPAGLVGRVGRVFPSSAEVMLLTDPRSSVYAVVQRPDSRSAGVIQGQLSGNLLMKFIPQGESVQVGDVIVTSERGLSFPRGLFIGIVRTVERTEVDPFQSATVEPAVPLHRLESVMVITNFLPARLDR